MAEISQLEIFNNAVKHKNCGKFLYYAGFTPKLDNDVRTWFGLDASVNLKEFFGMYSPVDVNLKMPDDYAEPDFTQYYKDIQIPQGSYIDRNGVLHVPGSMYHFTHFISPLRNAKTFSEIENFAYPDYSRYSEKGMYEATECAHSAGRVAVCHITHMYEDAWQIRGYEQFLEDMLLQPEWSEYILDRLMERNLTVAKAAARAGVDVLITGDDVANQKTLMFRPDLWRRMMKSRWAEVYSAAREIKPDIRIWYHSDGNIEQIVPELIETGVDILNPIQPECMDPVGIKSKYGDRLVLDGTIGTQSVMPFGTPEDVRKAVYRRIEELGQDGALILSPTHVLEPEVPIPNIIAFVEAVKEING